MTQDPFSIGRWVKRCRLSLGLTQDVLAERVGCATQTIRKIEGGQRRPSHQMAARLADALGFPAAERESFMQALFGLYENLSQPSTQAGPSAAYAYTLPIYLTPFVGREREQAAFAHLLGTPDHRLITLLGPGGIGKTRLAVQVARQSTFFAGGVVFVPLAPISKPHAIVPAIADALAFPFSGTTDLTVQLLSYLHDKELLLVLDNMEHLLSAEDSVVALVGRILAQAPRVKLLTTSRQRLKMQAEWVVEIEGLPEPANDALHGVTESPAFTLFIEHARRIQHGFHLSTDDEGAVAEICRLVSGMPLGIELAAAWVRVLSPQEIGQEITRGLETPAVAPQDIPDRHRSLQAVFDHSWRLLSEAERRVLRKLAIFHGGCTREAAANVAGASLAVLATLVDKSLLRRTGTGRYDLHELIRQYALAKLQEEPQEHTTTLDQHSAYYAAWLQARERPLKGAEQGVIVADMSMEVDNIRAAWDWAVDHRHLGDIGRSAETIHWFCEFRSWFQEGEALFRRATDALSHLSPGRSPQGETPAVNDEVTHSRVLGQVLADHAYVASRLGNFNQALALLDRSLFLLKQCDDSIALARALAYHGIVTYQVGDYNQSRLDLQESLTYARTGGDEGTIALCLTWLSMVEHALGAYCEAERSFCEGLVLWRAIGNPRTTLFCITFCSVTLCALNKYSEARTLLLESLALSKTTDDRWGTAMTLQHLGLIAHGQQDQAEAVRLFGEALALLRETGTRWEIARALNHLAAALSAVDDMAAAEQAYGEALTTAMAAQAIPDMLQALAGFATLRTYDRKYEVAFELILLIQQNGASRIETYNQAVHLRTAVVSHLSAQQIDAITERARARTLSEVVTVLFEIR